MIINLIDTNEKIVNAWKAYFSDIENVNIYHDSIFNIPSDWMSSLSQQITVLSFIVAFSIGTNLSSELWVIIKPPTC